MVFDGESTYFHILEVFQAFVNIRDYDYLENHSFLKDIQDKSLSGEYFLYLDKKFACDNLD